ncbi:MAG: PfkB family carbohydrate kinase, partial [Prolixibacteraceae bacterium]
TKTDIVKLNDEELFVFAQWHNQQQHDEKSQVKWFAEHYHAKMVCVTKGDKGAILYSNGKFVYHPGFKVQTVDTVGSGDAFLAALVASLLEGKSTADALAFACATGAFVATQAGATPAYDMNRISQIMQGMPF